MAHHELPDGGNHDILTVLNESILPKLSPVGYRLQLNAKKRTLNLLSIEVADLLAQEQFSPNQWSLLIMLLASYRDYAPYETLLASLTCLTATTCRAQLQEAQQVGSNKLRRELKPVRHAMLDVRKKLLNLAPHLEITSFRKVGYVLRIVPTNNEKQSEDLP